MTEIGTSATTNTTKKKGKNKNKNKNIKINQGIFIANHKCEDMVALKVLIGIYHL